MGTEIKPVAKVEDAEILSLASNPNFVEISSTGTQEKEYIWKTKIEVFLEKVIENEDEKFEDFELILENSITSEKYIFKPVLDANDVDDTHFYFHESAITSNLPSRSITAENIRQALLKNPFLKANYNIYTEFSGDTNSGTYSNASDVILETKEYHKNSPIEGSPSSSLYFACNNEKKEKLTQRPADSIMNNLVKGHNARIVLDVYRDVDIKLGEPSDITPNPGYPEYINYIMGNYSVSLSKAYNKKPVWFDLNTLWHNQAIYKNDFLTANSWCDAGTIHNFRLAIRRSDGIVNDLIKISPVHYVISGYERALGEIETDETKTRIKHNLLDYYALGHSSNLIRPLSKQPSATHVMGQTQYFNFILKQTGRNSEIGITYQLKSSSNKILATIPNQDRIQAKSLHTVNTIRLEIDDKIETVESDKDVQVAFVDIFLTQDGAQASERMTYRIVPSYMQDVNDFAFLNSLGGWSSFNFGAKTDNEFKASSATSHRTHTPRIGYSDALEAVDNKETEEQFAVETYPMRELEALWLKEMSSSIAVYELRTNRYIIVDDLNIKTTSKNELFTVEMKYRYSDSYNGNGKK